MRPRLGSHPPPVETIPPMRRSLLEILLWTLALLGPAGNLAAAISRLD